MQRISTRRAMHPFLLSLCPLCLCGAILAAAEPFKVTTRKQDDAVKVLDEKGKSVVEVKCPSGIGQAVIERTGEKWPEKVAIRLRLRGLEFFQIASGSILLRAAVSSTDPVGRVRQWKDGKEDAPLDAKSPYRMGIQLIGSDGKPATVIPIKDGFIEIALPKALFENNPKTLTVDWIDFYR